MSIKERVLSITKRSPLISPSFSKQNSPTGMPLSRISLISITTRWFWLSSPNYKNTRMKQILFLLFSIAVINLHLIAQTPDEPVENEFKTTAVPEKWNNESAVIIGQKTQYIFTRLASGKRYTTV